MTASARRARRTAAAASASRTRPRRQTGGLARAVASVAAALGVLVAATACAPASDGAAGSGGAAAPAGAPHLTIGLTYTPNIQFVAFYVAESKGYFADAGVDVELRHHGEAEDLFGALSGGTEQLVFAGGDEILQARSQAIDVESVATLYNAYPAALIVPADSPIRTAADVRGHSIGTPGPYGQTYFALLSLLKTNGMTTDDVKVEHIGYTQQVALTGGKVDGVMGFVNNDAVQFAEAGFPVRVIDVMKPGEQTLVGPALGASSTTIANSPDAVRGVLQALDRATAEVIADPQAAVDVAADYIPTLHSADAKARALATLEATIPLLQPTAGARPLENQAPVWERMAAFMQQQGLLGATPVTASESYTNEFLPMAG